jgi:hypothetical protein
MYEDKVATKDWQSSMELKLWVAQGKSAEALRFAKAQFLASGDSSE